MKDVANPSFLEMLYDRMVPPGTGNGVVVMRQVGLDEHVVGIACSGGQHTAVARRTPREDAWAPVAISPKAYTRLRDMISAAQLKPFDPEACDRLDGEAYFIKLVEDGKVLTGALVGPRNWGRGQDISFADDLDRFLKTGRRKVMWGLFKKRLSSILARK